MDSQHQQYPTDSVQQPVPKILPAAEFFSIVRKKLLAGRTVCFRVTGNNQRIYGRKRSCGISGIWRYCR